MFPKGFWGFAAKESLGEYGSGWGWEYNMYAHVFDQTDIDGTPRIYYDNGMIEGVCSYNMEMTSGELLYSKSLMVNQESCIPNVGNAGNYYSWATATSGGGSSGTEPNSICAKGWMLTTNAGEDRTSFYHLARVIYNIIVNNDSIIIQLPFSFVRSGQFSDSPSNRASVGSYLSSVAYNSINANGLYYYSNQFETQASIGKRSGHSIRCIAR